MSSSQPTRHLDERASSARDTGTTVDGAARTELSGVATDGDDATAEGDEACVLEQVVGGAVPAERVDPSQRSALDRLVRQVLLIEDAAPRAMFELRGSLVLSAIRCVLTYAVIPLVVPVISWAGVLATPLSLALSLVAIVLAVNSLRRVWMADYRHRWPYTVFILVAVGLLTMVVVLDVRTLLG
jgi:hypothetical protein